MLVVERTERELTPEEKIKYEEEQTQEKEVPTDSKTATDVRKDSGHDDIKICEYKR